MMTRPAIPSDADLLAPQLRPQDVIEIQAMHGRHVDLAEAVRTAIRCSSSAWTAFLGDEIAMVGGVADVGSLLTGNIGSPWLLGSRVMFARPGVLTRVGRRYVAFMHTTYPDLVNFIDARNDRSIAWLQRLGFTVHTGRPLEMGPDRMTFYRFTKSA